MESPTARLYQPNLTCSFDVTFTDDHNLWNLVMKNHDEAGITDHQFVTTLWAYCNVYTNKLIEEKIFKIEKEDDIPDAIAIVAHDKNYRTWSIIIQAQEMPLTQSSYIVNLAEVCKRLAQDLKINLKGLKEQFNDAKGI